MAFFDRKADSDSGENRSSDGPSLSRWNQWSDLKSFVPWVVFLLLLALWTYYLSRPDPADLQHRALQVMGNLKQMQEQKASEAQALDLLLTELEREENRNFTRGIWQHLSHALFVACFLILAVEIHTRRAARRDMQRHMDDVTKNVFQGVSQRLLGEAISWELRAILRENFVKKRAGYQFTFEGTFAGVNGEWVIVRQESWYDVRNLTGERENFPFRTSLLGYNKRKVDVSGQEVEFPHFVSVTIDDENCPLDGLRDAKNPFVLQKDIPFSKETLSIKVVTRLLYRTKDSVVLSSRYGMEQSEVTVSNEAADRIGKCEAVVLHNHTEQVRPRTSGQWEFDRALLPGQGWYVYWEERAHAELCDNHTVTRGNSDNHTIAHREPPSTPTSMNHPSASVNGSPTNTPKS